MDPALDGRRSACLENEPGELRNLAAEDKKTFQRLVRTLDMYLNEHSQNLGHARARAATERERAEMNALGYSGDEKD